MNGWKHWAAATVMSGGLFLGVTRAWAVLDVGDIAIIRVNNVVDSFTWVALKDIPVGEILTWRDASWNSTDGPWRTSELTTGTIDTSSIIAAGTIGNVSTSGFNGSGEQVFIHQGDFTTSSTSASAQFIFGVNWDNSGWITSGTTTTSTSYLPSTLTNANVAVGIGDHWYYNGATSGTREQLLTAITTAGNWVVASSTEGTTYADVRPGVASFNILPEGGGHDSSLSFNDTSPIDFGRVMVGATVTGVARTVQEDAGGSSAPTDFSLSSTTARIVPSPSNGTINDNGGSAGVTVYLNTDVAGSAVGTLTLTNTSGGTVANNTIATTGAVLNNRPITASAVALGRTMAGTTVNVTLTGNGADSSNTKPIVNAAVVNNLDAGVVLDSGAGGELSQASTTRTAAITFNQTGPVSATVVDLAALPNAVFNPESGVTGTQAINGGNPVNLSYSAQAVLENRQINGTRHIGNVLKGATLSGSDAAVTVSGGSQTDSHATRTILNDGVTTGNGITVTRSGGSVLFNDAGLNAQVQVAYSNVSFNTAGPNQVGAAHSIAGLLSSGETVPGAFAAGDIAIIGRINNGTPDSFVFVTLRDMAAGQSIYFTDNGWNQTTGAFRGATELDGNGSEGLMKWSAVNPVSAGTIIASNNTTSPDFTWTGSGAIPPGGIGNFLNVDLSQSGDQIYAFINSTSNNPLFYTATQTHLFVLDDTNGFEDSDTSSTGNVAPGLTAGATALSLNNVLGVLAFDPSVLSSGTKAQWLAAIADPANWTATGLPAGSITVTAEGQLGLLDGQTLTGTVAIEADVYEAAALTVNNSSNVGHGSTISIANAQASLLRAKAQVQDILLPSPQWSIDLSIGQWVNPGQSLDGSLQANTAGLLNGYVIAGGNLQIKLHNDLSIQGAALDDLNDGNYYAWTVNAHVVSGNSGNASAPVNQGQSYAGLYINGGATGGNSPAINTTVQFLDGSNSTESTQTLQVAFDNPNNRPVPANIASDIVRVTGIGGSVFVMQLSYDSVITGGATPMLGWFDPGDSSWKNAVLGNSSGAPNFVGAVAYNSVLTLGNWGYDSVNHLAWAVLDHNSDFAVLFEALNLLGDLNNDSVVNNQDIAPFVLALTDLASWQATYPGVNILTVGDINGDNVFNNQDIAPFVSLLTGGGTTLSSEEFNAIPEPASLGLLAFGSLLLGFRGRGKRGLRMSK